MLQPAVSNPGTASSNVRVKAIGSMYYLIYVSQATRPMNEEDLAAILQQSRDYNTRDAITGLLMYKFTPSERRGNFMQLLEGDKDKVLSAFERINADKRHHTKVLLEQGEIAERNFSNWSMGFRNVNTSDLDKFQGYSDLGSESFWNRARDGKVPEALALMLTFYTDLFADG